MSHRVMGTVILAQNLPLWDSLRWVGRPTYRYFTSWERRDGTIAVFDKSHNSNVI